jgi:N-acetylneuraminic acid mutarotase
MARGHVSAAVLRDRLYLIGGMRTHDVDPVDEADVQVYSPESDTWSAGPRLPSPRSHAEAATLTFADRILIIGGRDLRRYSRFGPVPNRLDQNLPNVTVLDPDRDSWSDEFSLPLGLRGAHAGVIDGSLVVAGGSTFMGSHGQASVLTVSLDGLL